MRELPPATNENIDEPIQPAHLCPECNTGARRLKHITYFTWLHGELITAPNFPAWVCDVCGRREYDSRAVAWLNAMLNPETGRRTPPRWKTGLPPRPRRSP